MTRVHNSEINLKSSAYNLAGENYFEQLSAYNSMRFHIRKVLLAKSVVDTRNKKYINNKSKVLKVQLPRKFSLDNFIDQLAFDTKHHPADLLRMNLDKYSSCSGEENCQTYFYNINKIDFSQLAMQGADRDSNNQNIYQNRSMLKSKRIVSSHNNDSQPKTVGKKLINSKRCIVKSKCRCEEKPIYVTCGKPFKSSTNSYRFDSGSSSSSMIQEDHASSSSSSPIHIYKRKNIDIEAKEDARYVKFAYEITKDIIKYSIYTDKELNEIFKKHLQRYRTTLDLNKMLKEIYRLKTFLNMSEESDLSEDDDMEFFNTDQIRLQKVRPPTPPKILDENKVIGKLLSYQKLMETQCAKEPRLKKSVVLIDANPELLITERDILTSLLEVGIDPKKAENICKSLQNKSMETVLDNMVELKIGNLSNESETSPDKLETHSDGSENVTDKLNNVEPEKGNSENIEDLKSNNSTSENENNKSSITDDLPSKQNETIQTPRSPVILHNDNYTEPMCSTHSRLHQEENLTLNVVDEVIQTEVQINRNRISINELESPIAKIYEEKKTFINANTEAQSTVPTDILAWSRDKIAKIKVRTSNDAEKKPTIKSDYQHRIPITKSTQKFLSSQKKSKKPKDSRVRSKTKLKQTKKLKRDKTPQRSGPSRAVVDSKPIKKKRSKVSVKSKKNVSQKKDEKSKKLKGNSVNTNNLSTLKDKEEINEPIKNGSTCVVGTCCDISITKLNLHKRESPKCVTRLDITRKNEKSKNDDKMIQQESKEEEQNEIKLMDVSDESAVN